MGGRDIEKGKPKCPVQHVHATALNYMYPASWTYSYTLCNV